MLLPFRSPLVPCPFQDEETITKQMIAFFNGPGPHKYVDYKREIDRMKRMQKEPPKTLRRETELRLFKAANPRKKISKEEAVQLIQQEATARISEKPAAGEIKAAPLEKTIKREVLRKVAEEKGVSLHGRGRRQVVGASKEEDDKLQNPEEQSATTISTAKKEIDAEDRPPSNDDEEEEEDAEAEAEIKEWRARASAALDDAKWHEKQRREEKEEKEAEKNIARELKKKEKEKKEKGLSLEEVAAREALRADGFESSASASPRSPSSSSSAQ